VILSPREKWLAIITGGVVVVAIILLSFAFQRDDTSQDNPEMLFLEE